MKRQNQHESDRLSCATWGFTLVELLVVISIIAMLIAILLPVLSKARESTQATLCVSNLRQLSITFHAYAADNDDWVPHTSNDAYSYPFPGEWFMFYSHYLMPSKMSPGPKNVYRLGQLMPVFDCPTTGSEYPGEIAYTGPDGPGLVPDKPFDYTLGYASRSIDRQGLTGKRIPDMRTDTILLIDHQADQAMHGSPSWTIMYIGTGRVPYMPGFHHNNGANILIMDGSAQLHPRDDYQPYWRSADGVLTPNPMKEYLSQPF